MKAEDRIIEALNVAKERGINIIRGPVFDWTTPGKWYDEREFPSACNAIGAVLLFLGKERLVGPDANNAFQIDWYKPIEEHLETNRAWLWRFCRGFDGGIQITLITTDKNGKEKTIKDDASALGISIRKKFQAP